MLILRFETDNDAFAEDWRSESAAVLHAVASHIEAGHSGGNIHDSNGNRIGQWRYTP